MAETRKKSALEQELEKRRLKLTITKAEAAKEEIEMKIMEHRINIERMEDHLKLQDERIAEAKANLSSIGTNNKED